MPPEFQLREAERQKMNNQKLAYDDDELLNKQEQAFEINPKDVDAYWLLRRMGDIIEDKEEKKEGRWRLENFKRRYSSAGNRFAGMFG